jgi:AGCS family alanine or glycine:cation symporter
MVGSVASLPVVWSFADVANGLMAIPNLISLLWLQRVIVAETRRYLWEAVPEAEPVVELGIPS